MAALKTYEVTTRNGVTRMKLSDADAEGYGDAAKPVQDARSREVEPAGPDDPNVVVDNGEGGTWTNLPDGDRSEGDGDGGNLVSSKARRSVSNKARTTDTQ